MARKTKITDEIIKICADNIRLGFSYTACSKAIGITYETWANWTKYGKEGKEPYSRFYIAIQEAEAELMRECLNAVKMSMKLGDVKSAMFLLERRFGSDGYGRQSQVDVKAETKNLNVNVNATQDENEKIRREILSKLTPRELTAGLNK